MAIKDTTKKPYIVDRDDEIFIGIDLPFRKSEGRDGWFASTTTTIEAVKNNIRNLLQTQQGERVFQPNLGMNLRQLLFEQQDEETIIQIENNIVDVFAIWLPFVELNDIKVEEADNQINLNVVFSLKRAPNSLESVQVTFKQ